MKDIIVKTVIASICQAVSALGAQLLPPLVSKPGQLAPIPSWALQSCSKVDGQAVNLSKPGADVSSWYQSKSSRCTIMGCLIEAGVHTDTELWFSDNLNTTDWEQYEFLQPWFFRQEFGLEPKSSQHYFLQTNGIGSKADIFVNGEQIADKVLQSGSYGGHLYEITSLVAQNNTVLVRTYPTNYKYDFSTGFVDWNPYPPDNSSGVWRDINIKQTGPVSMGSLFVTTDWKNTTASVTLKTTVTNLENHEVLVSVNGLVSNEDGSDSISITREISLGSYESKDIAIPFLVHEVKIWWPRQWGDQPLYSAGLTLTVGGIKSDLVTRSFGIRRVTKILNQHNDTQFFVNDQPFQVLGTGYTSDMFLRWSSERFRQMAQYCLDMGLNTIRIEGKMDQPELYDIADRLGIMILPGWECCGKWEAWSYNDVLLIDPVPVWDDADYATANASMRHESGWMQTHPSILGFLVGSDFWPDDKATAMYVDALNRASWQTPIIASASKRSYPKQLGPSGMKMDGPYDWVPPNYWWDRDPTESRLGSSFGFGSELGSGVGTPEIGSLKKFLLEAEIDDLWKDPGKKAYHVSTSVPWSLDRTAYNEALWARYGAPKTRDEYLLKCQVMDYEAIRAQYEGYSAFWNADRPATGLVFWMMNSAWPSLRWTQFDSYLHPGGSYFGTKMGSKLELAAFDNVNNAVYLINHSINKSGRRRVVVDIIDIHGKSLSSSSIIADTLPNTSKKIGHIPPGNSKTVTFLRLTLLDNTNKTISRNVYWNPPVLDKLDWANSTWSLTPVTQYADFGSLSSLTVADLSIRTTSKDSDAGSYQRVVLENKSMVPAFFIRLNLVDEAGEDIVPVFWSDNYITLWPGESLSISFRGNGSTAIDVSGWNIKDQRVTIAK